MTAFLNKLSKTILISASLVCFVFAAENLPVTAKATISKEKITIGDKVDFSLVVSGNGDVNISPVDLSQPLGAFEIKEQNQKGPYKSWGKTKLEYKLVLATFTSGDYEIPKIKVNYTGKDGVEKEVTSNKLVIHVEPVKAGPNDKDDIRDVKNPLSIPHSFWFWFFIVILPVLLIAAYFIVKFIRARNIKKEILKAEPERPPHEVAYERLNKLKELKLIEQLKIKEHYYIMSEIIRYYLEGRFSIPIVDRTTSETYKELLSTQKLKRKEITIIKDFLEECDLVKFAKMIPEAVKIDQDFDTAVSIVDMTKIVELQPVKDPSKGGAKS